jgi:Ran GTPase-activating protein (RanGAP) involved in mRNA processing and transport
MAVGPIGSAIFTNQMTPVATATQNAYNNRIDFQNMVAQAAVNEKDEKVLEVRPAEENQEVDADKDHTRDEADRENKRNKKEEHEEEQTEHEPLHKLDIKV